MSRPPRKNSASLPSEKRARTRERLIEAAAIAIAEKGFHSVTLDQIAARAGLTKGAIYDNFASKEQLFFEVMACNPSKLPFPESGLDRPLADRVAAFAHAVSGDGAEVSRQVPLRAEFLLYALSRPEMQAQMGQWLKEGCVAEAVNLARAFAPHELPMAPDRFILLLEAMIPGLMFLKSQAPDLVTEQVIADIFRGLMGTA